MLTLDQVKAKSAAKLEGLHLTVKAAAIRLIEIAYAKGVPIIIAQGYRTLAEQQAIYNQGRTTPGPIVSKAKPGESMHNYGVAIDFALLSPDGKAVYWDTNRDGDKDGRKDWGEVAEIAKELGFAWGGDWKSFPDYPHLEMTFGLSIRDYQAGKRPPVIKEPKPPVTEPTKTATPAVTYTRIPCPDWAEESVEKAGKKVPLSDLTGDETFYRFIVVLDRLGLLD